MKKTVTPELLTEIPFVGSPVVDQNNSFLISPIVYRNTKDNKTLSRLWYKPLQKGKKAKFLTSELTTCSDPQVSPDGRYVLYSGKFLENKSTKKQIYRLDLEGGEPEKITDFPLGAHSAKFFPDGKHMAVLVPLCRNALSVEKTKAHLKKKKEAHVKAYVTEERLYRFWDEWLVDGVLPHLFVVNLETKEFWDVTPKLKTWMGLGFDVPTYTIAHDGQAVVFQHHHETTNENENYWVVSEVALQFTKQGVKSQRKTLLSVQGKKNEDFFRPVYSSDGNYIVFSWRKNLSNYASKSQLIAYHRKKKTYHLLTHQDWDFDFQNAYFDPSGKTIFVIAPDRARYSLFKFDFTKALKSKNGVHPKQFYKGGFFTEIYPTSKEIYFSESALNRPREIFKLSSRNQKTKVSDFTSSYMKGVTLGKVKELVFKGADNEDVQMFLIEPPFAKKKKLPLVHMIHGGPHSFFGDNWSTRWNPQAVAALGYRVAMVNFHGSSSFGEKFKESLLGAYGGKSLVDIEKATDVLIQKGLVDPKKMAVTGGSYGGYMTAWICSQTQRYTCAINHAGVNDLNLKMSMDITTHLSKHMGSEFHKDISFYDNYNPIRFGKTFKTPMLITHGMNDFRVPYVHALQLYNLYKEKGLDARLIIYPDENHWILKTQNSLHWHNEFLKWLKIYLK